MKNTDNPMQRAHDAPRCTARSKRSGKPCMSPAVKGYSVCRMHGARGGAPTGVGNGNYSHGLRSAFYIELLGGSRLLSKAAKKFLSEHVKNIL